MGNPKSEVKAGALLSYATIAVNNVVGLVYTPYMLHCLGQSEYGLYSLVASVVAYLTILDLGFGNAIIRYGSELIAHKKEREESELYGMFLRLYSAIGLIAFGIGLLFYFNVNWFFDKTMTDNELNQIRIMMLLLIGNLSITFPMSIWGSIITAHEKFVFAKSVNIARIILNAAVMVVLLSWGYKAVAMVVVLTVFNILTLALNAWYCKTKLKIKLIYSKINWSYLREILSYSVWILLSVVVDRLYWSSGQFILGMTQGTIDIAILGVAIQLQAFYTSFAFAISGVLLPKIVKIISLNKDDITEVSDLFIKTGRLQFFVLALIYSGYILFGKKFVILWAGSDYTSVYAMGLVLLGCITFSSVQSVGYSILQALNKLEFRTITILITSIIAVGISYPLSKQYGAMGCVICIAVGILIGPVFIQNIYFQKIIKLDIKRFWNNLFKISIIPILLCFTYFFILQLLPTSSLWIYAAEIISYCVIYASLVYCCCFNEEEKSLVKQFIKKFSSH